MEKNQKEQAKEFIEDTLKDPISATDPLYPFFCVTQYSLKGRTAYEMLKRFENGQDILKDYDFGKNESRHGINAGIPVSLVKISKDIWVPENYTKNISTYDPLFKSFEIFDQDEYNSICFPIEKLEERRDLIRKVLYCQDKNKDALGKKLDLFLKNPSWREDAKKYSILLLENMNSCYKDEEFLKDFRDTTSKRAKKD